MEGILNSQLAAVGTFYGNENEKSFMIPPFQREYAWKVEQCRVLWEDILNSIRTGRKHFLGDITCSKITDDYIQITDGQQRFVSLMLLGLAIRFAVENEFRKAKNTEEYKSLIASAEKLVFARPLSNKGKQVMKITLNEDDSTVLNALVKDKGAAGVVGVELNKISEEIRKNCRIEPNYRYFYQSVVKFIRDGGNVVDILKAINSIQVTVLYCSIEDAQEIYSGKNAKGLPLSGVDLIKNLLLSKIPRNEQEKVFKEYWLAVERLVYRRNMDEFITDAMIILNDLTGVKDMDWKPTTLYKSMVSFLAALPSDKNKKNKAKNEAKQSLSVLQFLRRYAELYNKYINFAEGFDMRKATLLQQKMYVFEKIYNGAKGNCIILFLLDAFQCGHIKEEVLLEILQAFTVSQVRCKFVGQFKGMERKPATATFRKIRAELEKGRASVLDDEVWKMLLSVKGTKGLPSDETVQSYFTLNQLSATFGNVAKKQKLATRYLFYQMNAVANPKAGLPAFNENEYCVEHIIPPKMKNVWKRDLGVEDAELMSGYAEQIGNLALVVKETDDNYFDKKAVCYKTSPFPVTASIGRKKRYGLDDVKRQSEVYAKLFIKAFPIPNKYKEK